MTGHRWKAGLIATLAIVAGLVSSPPERSSAAPVAGQAGVDTSLPLTDSAVTVRGRGVFSNMEFVINQTSDLVDQAVSITWTGGVRTRPGPGDFGAHFVQIFQCWGDDDGSVAGQPGPPPEQCVQGAVAGRPGGVNPAVYPNGYALQRIVSRIGFPNAEAIAASGAGVLDSVSGNYLRPFRAVDGTVVDLPVNSRFNGSVSGGNFWLNPYFDINTTNEIAGARTGSNGRGSELFQVLSARQSSGLGCGQASQRQPDNSRTVPRCWIVIVPRGEPTAENVGLGPFEDSADQFGVFSSPLSPVAWQNRIAVPIEFKPVDTGCSLGADERRIVGTELAQSALTAWQPALCGERGLPPFNFAPIADATARQQLAAGVAGGPGMAIVQRPLTGPAATNPASPVVYSPVSVSSLVVGFNVERLPRVEAPPEAQLLAGVRVAQIDLTPRLVAKLLTQSYRSQVFVGGGDPDYDWADDNPNTLTLDPDFLRFNEEFELLRTDERLTGGLITPAGNSDAALMLWEYVFADPEARAWLGGQPDEFGMRVNPAYSTDASTNTTGVAFGTPLPSSFPKADPYCYQAPAKSPAPGLPATIIPPVLCGTDWMPNVARFAEAAENVRNGRDIARIVDNPSAQTPASVWVRDAPRPSGSRTFMAITDSASAARLGLQTARLSRPGDNGATRRFIAPSVQAMNAAVGAMAPRAEPTFLEPDHTADVPTAYPLTAVSYAVTRPLSLDAAARSDFASFVDYAATAGQVAGVEVGQLPAGYASMPTELVQQARASTERIRTLTAPSPTTTTAPTTPTTVVSSGTGGDVASAPVVPSGAAIPVTGSARPASSGSSSRPASSGSSGATGGPIDEVPASTVAPTEEVPVSVDDAPSTSIEGTATPPTTVAPATPLTPGLDLTRSRWALVALLVLALGSALGALEITKRARRATDDPEALDGFDGSDGSDEFDGSPVVASSAPHMSDIPVEVTVNA